LAKIATTSPEIASIVLCRQLGEAAANWPDAATHFASGTMTGDIFLSLLQGQGPLGMLHLCNGFPYGPRWKPLSSSAHALAIAGVDTDTGTATPSRHRSPISRGYR
jgi:hypothetical protein